MDFNYSPEDEAFRQEVRRWLAGNLPEGWGTEAFSLPQDEEELFRFELEWMRKLGAKGWTGPAWPKEYGGGGLSMMQTVVLGEELAKMNAMPRLASDTSFGFVGPTLLVFGTEEQKRRFLPPMIRGEELWCQGFSEPDAGSDLAALKTKATVDGDYYVINGQKVWSSLAHRGDWQILLVRTDPAAPKHKGITFLLVDMRTPGIDVRPLKQITGSAEFNEVFYDNVRVPRSNLIGQENRGWYVSMTTLGFERTGTERGITFKQAISDLALLASKTIRNGRPAIDDPAIQQKLAQCAIEIEIVVLNGYRTLSNHIKGRDPGPEEQMGKVFWSEMFVRLTELATAILGPDCLLDSDDPALRSWQRSFLMAKGATIAMGTSEILRNLIGERVLGLPR